MISALMLGACGPTVDLEEEDAEDTGTGAQQVACENFVFPDPHLAAGAAAAIPIGFARNDDGSFSAAALAAMTHLRASDVASTDGLECLTGLEGFELERSVVDLDALPSFPRLTDLAFHDSELVGSWAGLAEKSPGVERFTLDVLYTSAPIVPPLALSDLFDWTNLHELSVRGAPIANGRLDGALGLDSLEVLEIMQGGVADVSGLRGHLTLQRLELPLNELTSFDTGPLPTLTHLDLLGNDVSNLPLFPRLTSLHALILDGNDISTVEGIDNFQALKSLSLRDTSVESFTLGLLAGTEVESLDLAENGLEDASYLIGAGSLRSIDLSQNNIEEISSLQEALWVDGCAQLYLNDNPLTQEATTTIDVLCETGVLVEWAGDSCNSDCAPAPGSAPTME